MHTHDRRCTRGFTIFQKLDHFLPNRPAGACWIWNGALVGGYGVIHLEGKNLRAHRVAYTEFVGPIPGGLTIDHVAARGCTSKACCNPAHLEAVSNGDNKRRAMSGICRRGHVMTGRRKRPEGRTSRYCLECRRKPVGHVASRID